ncbi:hypothetical protein [Viridibacterium curvum]|uniref:DUF4123 domain-containing protein n=1 Tax=Viridibacterium curvum TaxID=1101404 RepID=A0ABP9R792_9RHOO
MNTNRALSFSGALQLEQLPTYALIDPFFGEPPAWDCITDTAQTFDALADARAAVWERQIWVADSPKPLVSPHRLPYLVELNGARDPLIKQLCEYAQEEQMTSADNVASTEYRLGSFVQTSLPPALLMGRLQTMWAYRFGGAAPRYLRIADRRVMELLCHLLQPESIAAWLGPIARWHVLSRRGVWISASGILDETQFDENESLRRVESLSASALSTARLRPTPAEHLRIASSEAASRALLLWQRAGKVVDDSAHRAVWAGIETARTHSLSSPEDLAEFAWRWMANSNCAVQPPLREALEQRRNELRPLSEILDTLSAVAD